MNELTIINPTLLKATLHQSDTYFRFFLSFSGSMNTELNLKNVWFATDKVKLISIEAMTVKPKYKRQKLWNFFGAAVA